MDEPQEVTDRRWRFNLMAAVEHLAASKKRNDLHDSELIEGFLDCVSDGGVARGDGAMTTDERVATERLCRAIEEICDKARLMKRQRIGGKVVHSLEPDDLVSLGWMERVQPAAAEALEVFLKRGGLDEGLWPTR
ncbi:MAG: hypothetical protein M3177_03065 [Pseudomonadota bacterium]|nr:hypothetical protein [Pseudomonadota bacterium]